MRNQVVVVVVIIVVVVVVVVVVMFKLSLCSPTLVSFSKYKVNVLSCFMFSAV